jgi:hypothetical protein
MPRVKAEAVPAALFGDLADAALIILDLQHDHLAPAALAPRSTMMSIPGTTKFEQRF